MTERFLFPDCNIFLHYTFFTDVDWATVASVDGVELVIAYTVISKLDEKKFESADAVVRERAQRVIARFSKIEVGSPIRDNVTLNLLYHEPNVDYTEPGLNRDSEDDRIIAEILRYHQTYPDRDIAVVTADLGMKLKCKGQGIPVLEMPEEHRLPDRLDAYSKQIRELQARIAELEGAQPKLRLVFSSGEVFLRVKFSPPRLFSDAEIQQRLQEKREELASRQAKPYYARVTNINYGLIDQAEAREILTDYESCLKKSNEYAKNMARVIYLRFVLMNDGNASADDTDVYIYFDGKFLVVDEDNLPKRPKMPEERKRESFRQTILGSMPPVPVFEESNVTGPTIRRTPSEQIVQFHVERLKQGTHVALNGVYADLTATSEIKSFGLRYTLNSHSLPKDAEGELHVIFETS